MMKSHDPMKSKGIWEVRRQIKIPALVHATDTMAVEEALSRLSGICKVVAKVDKHQLAVPYDASQTDYLMIVDILESTGFPSLDNW